MGFLMDQMALRQVFLRVPQFSTVSIIPPMLHTHLHLHVAFTRRTKGQILRTFQKAVYRGVLERKVLSLSDFKGLNFIYLMRSIFI
jgi:hypothetical protein